MPPVHFSQQVAASVHSANKTRLLCILGVLSLTRSANNLLWLVVSFLAEMAHQSLYRTGVLLFCLIHMSECTIIRKCFPKMSQSSNKVSTNKKINGLPPLFLANLGSIVSSQ